VPTGYTSIVEDHDAVTFEQYLWRCARAFGAFIMQRDDGLDATVPLERVPAPYYETYARECRERLRAAEEMTLDGAALAMSAANEQTLRFHEEMETSRKKKCAQYDRMRAKVKAWEPPTPEHAALKKFMLEQLDTGYPDYMRKPEEPPRPATDPEAWRAKEIEEAKANLARAEARVAEEIARCEEATAWIQALNQQTPWVPQP
jgi:hypothetical protein